MGHSRRGTHFHPSQQGRYNRELSLPCKWWKPRPGPPPVGGTSGGPQCSWLWGSGFPSSVALGGATRCPGTGLQSSVQALVETQPAGQEEDPGSPGLSGEHVHAALPEHFLNAGATPGHVQARPGLTMVMLQKWALATIPSDVRISLPSQITLEQNPTQKCVRETIYINNKNLTLL